jgi:beta-glucanase (GH16 family)
MMFTLSSIPRVWRMAPLLLLTATPASSQDWRLVWSDEFNGAANTLPSAGNWTYDLGNGSPGNPGWGNHELESYTASTANVFQDGSGNLVIRALNDGGVYTSGRIKTQNLFSFTYGKVEARIKIPYAQGIWPAFWMLGANIVPVGWPACGEIDIMENFGVQNGDASRNHGTLHGPGYPGTGITGLYTMPAGQKFADDFHVFSVEWEPDRVEFFVDGNSYLKTTPASMPAGSQWVFNGHPFFLLLNVAVGGSPAPVGNPSATAFPQEMLVDYVRVYQAGRKLPVGKR